MFDQFMIGAYVRHYITAVGAIEQFHYPIWGQIIKQYGVIPIVRNQIRKAIKSLSTAEDALNNGVSFIISPEGTRTLTGELSPFKKGPFHLAKNTGATIVPIGLHGGLKAKKKDDWRLSPGILTTSFGTPITKMEYGDLTVDEIKDLVRERIQKLIAT
jgi:1-acyl-sn-glycerol-3-phosphate acyltransferase